MIVGGGEQMLEYRGVGCTRGSFFYVARGCATKSINLSRVRRVSLHHGIQAQHPMLLLAVGFTLVAFLAWPILRLLDFLEHGGSISSYDFYVGALALLGGWLVYDTIKKGWFLELELERGTTKLAFDRGAEPEGLKEFVRRASAETEMPIDDSDLSR